MPPAIAYGGAFIFLVAAFIVAWGLLTVYRLSLKQLLLGIAALFNLRIGIPHISSARPLGAIADALTHLADTIDHALAEAVLASESGIVWLWHALAKQAEWLGNLLGDLAETFEAQFRAWYLAFPPLALIWAAVKAYQGLPALLHAVHGTSTTVVHVTKTYVTRIVHQAVAATAGTVTAPLPWVRGRITGIEHDLAGLRARLRGLEKPLIGGAVVALIGAALARLGLGWARCKNVNRVGKQVCGMNPDLLESLLASTVLVVGTVGLVEFARGMQGVMGEIDGPVRKFWRAV